MRPPPRAIGEFPVGPSPRRAGSAGRRIRRAANAAARHDGGMEAAGAPARDKWFYSNDAVSVMMKLLDSRFRILLILVFSTMSAFAVEMYFSVISNSMALAVDSVHTLMDAVVVFVSIIAARVAMRPADEKHSYGYGKIEPLGYMLCGIAIIVLSGLFIYESANRLQAPPVIPPQSMIDEWAHVDVVAALFAPADGIHLSLIGVWGGVYVILTDVFKIYVLQRAIKGFGGATFKSDRQHSFIDISATTLTISSIPITFFGFYYMDSVATLVLGVLLGLISIRISYKAAQELLDVTSPTMVNEIKTIIQSMPEVLRVGPVMLRRSGDKLFADATAVVRGDTSVDAAHDLSEEIERRVKDKVTTGPIEEDHSHGLAEEIKDAMITIRVEPDWTDVPIESKIVEIAKTVDEVLDASHASTHKIDEKIYADLRVKVDKDTSLAATYAISNRIEARIKDGLPGIERTTIRLEPHDDLADKPIQEDLDTEQLIRSILDKHPEILGTIKIISLKFGNVYKIDIDCMLDGEDTITQTHQVLTSIEYDIIKEIKNAIITIHPVPV